MIDTRGYVSVAEAAERLHLSPEQVRRRLRDGQLKGEHVGHQWFVERASMIPAKPPMQSLIPRELLEDVKKMRGAIRKPNLSMHSGPAFLRMMNLIGCQMLRPEITSVLREKTYEGIITHEEAGIYLERVWALDMRTSVAREQFQLAMDLANRTNRYKAYDMQYVAVAVLERCEMVTLDGGVYQAAREQRINARLLR